MTKEKINYKNLPNNNILCVDMKSFYASIESVDRGLNPWKVPLAVVGNKERKGGVILAATPAMKKQFNLGTANRAYQIPENSDIIIAEARMGLYVEVSIEITRLFNEYIPLDDIHVYSIDESWLKLNKDKKESWKTAKNIKNELLKKFKLPSSMGLGPNMFLAKVAMDVEGKKKGLVRWTYDDIENKLWPLPLEKCWGIGKRLAKKFKKIGVKTMGDLAHLPLDYLENKFGIMGNQLYYHAWGIDLSKVEGHYLDKKKSIGRGITLYRDYTELEEIKTVIFDLSEEVAKRARQNKVIGKTISLTIIYSKNELNKGFSRQKTINEYTNFSSDIYNTNLKLLKKYYTGEKVRKISVNLSNLISDKQIQLSLFNNTNEKMNLAKTKDELRKKFGHKSLFYGRSLKNSSIRSRINETIGGHKA
ncbi:MAG: DNA polymerase thumb domain-containing protein [Bacillota bacterium]